MNRRLLAVLPLVLANPAIADTLPTRPGHCVMTAVDQVGTRLMDSPNKPAPDTGSAIAFTNGGYQVSYDQVPAVDNSRPGDRVKMCLVAIPKDCPPGDNRGRVYRTTNLRTHRSWTLPDAQHSCGGA